MNKEIDLSKYQLRTDLAIESVNQTKDLEGIEVSTETIDDIKVTEVNINELGSKKTNKKTGNYITIEFEDITDTNNKNKVLKIFSNKLKELIKKIGIYEYDSFSAIQKK